MAKDLIRLMQTLLLPEPSMQRWRPAADVYRTRHGWLVKFDLAGVRPEDISLSIQGRRLILQGCRRDYVTEQDCRCYTMEISYSRFERTIEMPDDLSNARISAEHHEGMVLVRIEEAKP